MSLAMTLQFCSSNGSVVAGRLPEAALKGKFNGEGSVEPPYHLIYWDPNQPMALPSLQR